MNQQRKKLIVFFSFILIITTICVIGYFWILKPIKDKRKASGSAEKFMLKKKPRTSYDPDFLDTAIRYKKK